jgi:soluble lytic murein transglycosylase
VNFSEALRPVFLVMRIPALLRKNCGRSPGLLLAGVAGAALLLALGAFFYLAEDPWYSVQEIMPGSRYRSFDGLILATALRHEVDPSLVKAVIWQESRFRPGATGAAGERGLMQVTEVAAQDWVQANQIANFVPADLFDPATNLEVGVWYLGRALRRHAEKDDPRPFALAEFNAGASRVNRWMSAQSADNQKGAETFRKQIDFPLTAAYISSILARHDFYRRRGEFGTPVTSDHG